MSRQATVYQVSRVRVLVMLLQGRYVELHHAFHTLATLADMDRVSYQNALSLTLAQLAPEGLASRLEEFEAPASHTEY